MNERACLFQPIALREVTLKNRIVVAPMSTYCARDGVVDDFHLVHLGRFALGGAGLIISEAVAVSENGRITHDPFRRYWREIHGPLASTIPPLRRYEQNHLALSAYAAGEPTYDGLAITWFASTAAMREGTTTPHYAATRADEAHFLPDGHLPIIITRENVFVPPGG